MERLTLNRRPKTGDKVECLPAGDGLPIWSTIPLDAKLPMMKNPKGSVTLCTTKLGEPKHKCKQEYDFDLRDPYGKYVCNEYQPLHDPHLKAHFKSHVMRRHLIRQGFISEDGKVMCSLREFNQYRQYLRHVFFLEIARQRKEELEKIHRQVSQQRLHDVDRKVSRSTVVRERLQQQREEQMHRLNNEICSKQERLERRLQEIREEVAQRERMRREEAEIRQQNIYKNQQETEQHKFVLLKKWRQQERLRNKLLEDRELQRTLQAEMKCIAKWNKRKLVQQEKLAHEEEVLRQEEEDRQRNIATREKYMIKQRRTLQRKLAKLKKRMREEKLRRDELYAKRFEAKLASGDYQVWTKRRDKQLTRQSRTFNSTWKLQDILNNLTLADTQTEDQTQPLPVMTEQTFDEFSDIDSQSIEQDMELLQEKARGIVQGVLSKVINEIYPAYLKMMNEEEGQAAMNSRSVRFCEDEDQIRIEIQSPGYDSVEGDDEDNEYFGMRPVSEHILTPVASQLEIQKLEAEAILGSPEIGDKTSSVTFVETLLLRLLDDLNSGKLSKDDIMKLASYSMDIIQSAETGVRLDGTILEATDEADIGNQQAVASSSSVIAKKMVDFTLGKILSDIQMGNVHPDDLASLTVSVLDDASPSLVSSASISVSEADLDNYIDETLRAATASAVDPREDSPVCEALLDEFMVSTLKHLIQDLENDVLSKAQVETLALSVKEETKITMPSECEDDIRDSKALQKVLLDILHEMDNEAIDMHNLYQIVFAVVYSYNMIKAPPTPCYENRITSLMRDIMSTAEQKAIAGELEHVNVNIVREANERLSQKTLDVNQIEQISSSIISTVSRPEVVCRTTTSDIARSIVEDALSRAKHKLEKNEHNEEQLSLGIQNVAEAVISTTANVGSADRMQVSVSLLQVLKNLKVMIEKSGEIEKADIDDIDTLISQISENEIDPGQVEEIAFTIARVIRSPVMSDSSLSANLIVADVLRKVEIELQQGLVESNVVTQMMEIVSTAVRAAQAMDMRSPALLCALYSFLKTVLSYVTHKVQTGEFTETDIKELSKAMKENIAQNDSLLSWKETVFKDNTPPDEGSEMVVNDQKQGESQEVIQHVVQLEQSLTEEYAEGKCAENQDIPIVPEKCEDETKSVLQYFQKLLNDVETGKIDTDAVNTLGKRLIKCGKTLLDNLSGCSSTVLTPRSDVIASGVVEEVIRSLQQEIDSGSLSQDNVKELTKTIISSTSSKSDLAEKLVGHTIRGIHRDIERGYEPARLHSVPTIDHSPSASTIASHVVLHTIEAINGDMLQTVLSDTLIVSVASSVITLITEDRNRPVDLPQDIKHFKSTISAISKCLKNDSIARSEAERIFCIILEKYKDFVCGKESKQTDSLADEDMSLVNELVTETLHNIERSVQRGMISVKEFSIPSLPHSEGTSVAAEKLVDQCLDTIRQDISYGQRLHHDHYTDISDFILDIVKKLRLELSLGTISKLSMAHFFQVISDDTSDLKTLEENAAENLVRVIHDIQVKKANSIYIHRILEAYLTAEPMPSSLFGDPLKAVESILINISSDILTKFVKATLQNILIEMREGSCTLPDKPPSVFAIQSASSLIAENVIQEVISRIKEDMTKSVHKIHGKVSKVELERAASKLLCDSPIKDQKGSPLDIDYKHSSSNQSISSVHSKDIEDIVLETLHNIVSNLRFEQSVQVHKHVDTEENSSDISSEIQDFVLNTLQNIVTDLQDRRSQIELGVAKYKSRYGSSVELVSGESKEAMAYVNEVLQTVLNDMKREFAAREHDSHETNAQSVDSHTDTSNLETIILDCLQNAVSNEPSRSETNNLDKNQKRGMQTIVIEAIVATLKNINENRLSDREMITVNNAISKFIDAYEMKNEDITLQEQLSNSLERVLNKVREQEIDDATLNRIATQVATLGMDINLSDRRSPETVESSSSVSSSIIGELVKDVLSRISQQMEAEENRAHITRTDGHLRDGETDVNFNRKESASSTRTDTSLISADAFVEANLEEKNNSSHKKNVKTKVKNFLRSSLDKRPSEKKASCKPYTQQEPQTSALNQTVRKGKCPVEATVSVQKIKKERNPLPKLVSPVSGRSTAEVKEFKPSMTAAVSAKHSKSEQNGRRSGGKSIVSGFTPVTHENKKVSRKPRQKSSKKKTDTSTKATYINVAAEDPSVVKSLCGVHKTKISIRQGQN